MTGGTAFLKKEFREILSTYKIYVIPAILLFFGLTSPLLAKLTPEILKSFAKDFVVKMPTPTAADAYLQFFKNLNQIGLLAVIFTSIGLVAEEKIRGTAALLMTKPVPRWSFIVDKFIASAVLVLAATAVSYLACLYYTYVLFSDAVFAVSAQAVLLMIVYYLLILAVTILASVVSRSVALSGAISLGGFFVLSLLPSLHRWLAKYSPGAIPNYQNKLLQKTAVLGDALPCLLITLGATAAVLVLSVMIYKRQEL